MDDKEQNARKDGEKDVISKLKERKNKKSKAKKKRHCNKSKERKGGKDVDRKGKKTGYAERKGKKR